eukprot:g28340.t1
MSSPMREYPAGECMALERGQGLSGPNSGLHPPQGGVPGNLTRVSTGETKGAPSETAIPSVWGGDDSPGGERGVTRRESQCLSVLKLTGRGRLRDVTGGGPVLTQRESPRMVALVSGITPVDSTGSSCLLCSVCHFLLIKPKQTECGHRYCTACLENLF